MIRKTAGAMMVWMLLVAAHGLFAADDAEPVSLVARLKQRPELNVYEVEYGDWGALGDAPSVTGCFVFYGPTDDAAVFGVAYVHHKQLRYEATFVRDDFEAWFGRAAASPVYCVATVQVEKADPGVSHGRHYRVSQCEMHGDARALTKLVEQCREDFLARFDASHPEAAQWTAALLKDNPDVEEKDRAAELPKGVYQQPERDYKQRWEPRGEMKFHLARGMNDIPVIVYDKETKTLRVHFEDWINCSYMEELSPLSSRLAEVKPVGNTQLLSVIYEIRTPFALSLVHVYGPDSAAAVAVRVR